MGENLSLPLKRLQTLNSWNSASYENGVNCASYGNYVSYENCGLRVD